MKTLGSLVVEFEPSQEDIDRIKDTLHETKDFTNELMDCITTSSQGKRVLDSMKINGFRQKSHGFYKQAITQIFANIERGSSDKRCWDIYRIGIGEFIHKNYNSLHRLLAETEVPGDQEDEEVLVHICKNAKYFGVLSERVQWFYEVYFFPRTDSFDELLDLCKKGDPDLEKVYELKDVRNTVDELNTRIEKLESAKSINETLSDKYIDLEHLDSRIDSLGIEEKISALRKQIESVVVSNEGIDSKIKHERTADGGYRDLIVGLQKDVGKLFVLLNEINQAQKEFQESLDIESKLLGEKVSNDLSEAKRDLVVLCEKLISANEVKLVANLNAISADSLYVPLLLNNIRHREFPVKNIEKDSEFLDYFSSLLDRDQRKISNLSAKVVHILFSISPVIVTDDSGLYNCWIEALGWSSNKLQLVASPSWVDKKDWADGVHHLFKKLDLLPNILEIHDFDIGVYEGYLLPSLKLWQLNEFLPTYAKLLLIPTKNIRNKLTSSLLDKSIYIEIDEILKLVENFEGTFNTGYSKNTKLSQNAKSKKGVGVKVFENWVENYLPSSSRLNEEVIKIRPLQESLSLDISREAIKKYELIKLVFANDFSKDFAEQLAKAVILRPWILNEYDENKYNEFCESLKELSL